MNQTKLIAFIGLVLVLIIGCDNQKRKIKTGEGFVNVRGGKIWYRVVGEGDKIPILLLHGGPGSASYYLNPLRPLSNDRSVITFDQLGCGRSDGITDTSLMTMDNYVEQIKQLLTTLEVKDVYLYGHSWGTMLGTDYYLKYPEGVHALILASPLLSTNLWVKDADTLISMLPDTIQFVLNESKKSSPQDSSKLAKAIEYYVKNYYARKPSISYRDSTGSKAGENVYRYMWGNSEFHATGTLKNYDRTSDLKKIRVPTLYITGEFDAARPATVKYYQTLTPNSKFEIIKGAGHDTMNDNPDADIKVISSFLSDLEKN